MLLNQRRVSLVALFLTSTLIVGCQSPTTKERETMNTISDFSFSSREWIKNDLPDSVAATASVKKLTQQVYAITYHIKPEVLNSKTQITGTDFAYNWSELSNFHFCVIGNITAKAGFTQALLGHSSEEEGLSSPVTFYIVPFTGSKPQSPTLKGVEWAEKPMDYATSPEFKAQCAHFIKTEYLW